MPERGNDSATAQAVLGPEISSSDRIWGMFAERAAGFRINRNDRENSMCCRILRSMERTGPMRASILAMRRLRMRSRDVSRSVTLILDIDSGSGSAYGILRIDSPLSMGKPCDLARFRHRGA